MKINLSLKKAAKGSLSEINSFNDKKMYAEDVNSDSLNGEDAKAAKERAKSDGFIAGAAVVAIAWAANSLTNWVMEKFSKA